MSNVNPETLVKLRRENIKFRSQVDDAEEPIAEWQSTFGTMDTKIIKMQSKNQDFVNMCDFIPSELESSQGTCRALRRELQEVQDRGVRLKFHVVFFSTARTHGAISRMEKLTHQCKMSKAPCRHTDPALKGSHNDVFAQQE